MNGIKVLQIQRIEKEMRMRLAVTIQKCNTLRGLVVNGDISIPAKTCNQQWFRTRALLSLCKVMQGYASSSDSTITVLNFHRWIILRENTIKI